MSRRPPTTPDLWSVVAPVCSALSLGVLGGALGALRRINPDLVFRVDFLAVAVGLASAGVGWQVARGLWRLAQGDGNAEAGTNRTRRGVWLGLGALAFAVLTGFALATRNLPDSRRRDMIAGGILALLVIGAVAGLIRMLAGIFGSPDGPDEGSETRSPKESSEP